MAAEVVPTNIIPNLQALNDYNYGYWSIRVKTYLIAEDLWDVVEATAEPPKLKDDEDKYKAWRKINARALHVMYSSCGTDALHLLQGIHTAKGIWDTLAENFKPKPKEELVQWGMPDDQDLNAGPKLDDHHGPGSNSRRINFASLLEFVMKGEWDSVNVYLTRNPDAIRERCRTSGMTALHTAVLHGRLHVVKELVALMTEDDLEIQNDNGATAIAIAARTGFTPTVKCLVEKNKKILSIPCYHSNYIPLLIAFCEGHMELARYLYSVTPVEALLKDKGSQGGQLISLSFAAKELDIALDLIRHYPKLGFAVNYYGVTPLQISARIPSLFLSTTHMRFWQKWIYHSIHMRRHASAVRQFCIDVQTSENDQVNPHDLITRSAMGLWRGLVSSLLKLFGISRIYKMKLIHVQTLEIIHHVCGLTKHKSSKKLSVNALPEAIFESIRHGHVELIKELCKANLEVLGITDENGKNMLHYAIEYRQEKAYILLCKLRKLTYPLASRVDNLKNSVLHSAASLSPSAQLDHIKGAALQMQRELQWFKAVKKILPHENLDIVNRTDRMKAGELFTKNNKELRKEGERAMKETSTSCMVVGALNITIMFTTAFIVPGGYNGGTGMPMLLREKLFKVFIVADAISLFSSTTSVMIFLGILTSRYAEDDFLTSLPTKMILGLSTLFFSIATMMVAFVSTLFIVLDEKPWILLMSITSLASVPVISFVSMQFPLLVEIFFSTYAARICGKKVLPLVWEP